MSKPTILPKRWITVDGVEYFLGSDSTWHRTRTVPPGSTIVMSHTKAAFLDRIAYLEAEVEALKGIP